MLNQVVLVGRLTDDIEVVSRENGKKVCSLVLAVQRTFKNSDGIYEADFIRCTLWNAVASSTSEYCHKGDIIGVKGRIRVDEDGMKIVGEKVTFLSSRTKDDEDEDIEE